MLIDSSSGVSTLMQVRVLDPRWPRICSDGRIKCDSMLLRDVRDEDLPLLFEQWTDPIAGHMAAFTTPDQAD